MICDALLNLVRLVTRARKISPGHRRAPELQFSWTPLAAVSPGTCGRESYFCFVKPRLRWDNQPCFDCSVVIVHYNLFCLNIERYLCIHSVHWIALLVVVPMVLCSCLDATDLAVRFFLYILLPPAPSPRGGCVVVKVQVEEERQAEDVIFLSFWQANDLYTYTYV